MERIDDLQRSGLRILQDPDRFCFGMDAVLLSGFVTVKRGEKVTDLCTGTGIIPLLLSAKTEASEIDGIEIQPEDLAKESHIIWIDAGRIRLSENQEDAVDPSEVAGDKTGGVFPSGCYPDSSTLL